MSMRKAMSVLFDVIKVFVLFTGCTIMFYFAILWINEEYQNYHRYKQPQSESVEQVSGIPSAGWVSRVIFFYENGE